jgi:fluoride exporter
MARPSRSSLFSESRSAHTVPHRHRRVHRIDPSLSAQQLSKGFQVPFGTLAVNVVGCVLVGFLAEVADQRSFISDETRGFLIVGILGGFTTFSAFGNETMTLLRSGELWLAGINIVGHMVLGLIAVWLGYSTASLIWK